MNPKIRTVVIKKGGRKATVSGPIRWDSDETSATFSAVIAQMSPGGATVLATGQNPRLFRNPGDLTWKATVRTVGGGRLVPGSADGWAVAAVLETTGSHECYPWQVDNLDVT
jgi:hypothetical protein